MSSDRTRRAAGAGQVQRRRRHPPRRSHRGGDQDQEPAGRQDPRGHSARRRPAGGHHPAATAPPRPISCPTPWVISRQTISGLNTDQLSESLSMLAETFQDTPPDLKVAVDGRGPVLRDPQRARRPAARAAGQRQQGRPPCWPSAATRWSAWSQTPTRCWRSCRTQSAALDQISGNISALSQAAAGFIADNRDTTAGPRSTSSTAC